MKSYLTGWLTFIFTFTILNCLFAQTDQWRLSWDMNSENDITQYKIYRYTSSQHNQIDDSLYATVPHSINTDSSEVNHGDSTITFFDRHLRPGVLFNYRVKAVNSESLESNYSDYVSAAIPQISTIPSLEIDEGQSFPILDLDNYVSDRDNSDGELTWTESGHSALNISINTTNHNLTVTVPNPDWNGSDTLTLTATDPGGFWDSTQVIFKVNPVGERPSIAGSGQYKNLNVIDKTVTLVEDTPGICPDSVWYEFVEDGDTDDADLIYTIRESRYIQSSHTENGQLLSPVVNFCKIDTLKLIVSDGMRADSAYFMVDVFPVNDAPQISSFPPLEINEGQSFPIIDLDNYVSDVDNSDEEINWAASGQSELNVSINATNHNLTVTVPNPDWNGSDTLTLTATDPGGFLDSTQVIFKVNPVGERPSIAGTGQYKNLNVIDKTVTLVEDTPGICPDSVWYEFVEDGDTDDADLIYAIRESRYIQSSHTENGQILSPVINFCKKDTLKLIVSDGVSADSAYFMVDVFPVNDAPQISSFPPLEINEGQSFPILDLDNYVSDVDNSDEEITWTASGHSALNISINSSNHNLTVTVPNPDWNGSDTLTLTATDPGGFRDSTQVIFKVNPVDENPTEESPSIAGSGQYKNLNMIDKTVVLVEDIPGICPDSVWYEFVEDGDTDDADLIYTIRESRYIQSSHTENGQILSPVINFCKTDTLKLVVSDGSRADSAYFMVEVCPVNDAPEQSQTIRPSHNTFVEQSDSIIFEWSSSYDPDGGPIYYDLTIREEDGFNEIHIIDIEATSFKLYIPAGFEPGEFYSWNVTSKDGYVEVVSDTSLFYVVPTSIIIDDPWTNGSLTYQLSQNFPNPFNPTTEIQYMLADAGHVTIEVFNTLGQRVSRLVDEFKDAGQYIVEFDSQGLSSGIYFYHIRTNDFHDIRKMILRK